MTDSERQIQLIADEIEDSQIMLARAIATAGKELEEKVVVMQEVNRIGADPSRAVVLTLKRLGKGEALFSNEVDFLLDRPELVQVIMERLSLGKADRFSRLLQAARDELEAYGHRLSCGG